LHVPRGSHRKVAFRLTDLAVRSVFHSSDGPVHTWGVQHGEQKHSGFRNLPFVD
jgi:hypothetical protein